MLRLVVLNLDFAVDVVARRRKPQRNEQLERFCDEGIFINMLRSKIVKQALQQGFSSRSRWLLQILGLILVSKLEIQDVDIPKQKAEPKPCLLEDTLKRILYSASYLINGNNPSINSLTCSLISLFSFIAVTIAGLNW